MAIGQRLKGLLLGALGYPHVVQELVDMLNLIDPTSAAVAVLESEVADLQEDVAELQPGGLLAVSGTLTSDQILDSFDNPIEVLPEVSGYVYIIDSMYSTMEFNSEAYVTYEDPLDPGTFDGIVLAYETGPTDLYQCMTADFVQAEENAFDYEVNTNDVPAVGSSAVIIRSPTANPEDGDSEIKYRIYYRLVPELL